MLLKHSVAPEPHILCLTVFTTALCNLNCQYCYICKDEAGGLVNLDKEIEKMFENGDYITYSKLVDPDIGDHLTDISLWGGEPFLGIYRFIDHIKDFFKAFPHVEHIDVSTNLNLSDHPERIQALIDAVDKNFYLLKVSNKPFRFSIQISIDGYEEMNDAGRGKGSTKRIVENWKKIVNNLTYDTSKFDIEFFTKATFSKDTWQYVNTPDKAYKWCEFLDNNLHKPWRESECKAFYRHGLWNNAMPTEYFKEDGIKYIDVVKSFSAIRHKVKENLPGFEYYPTVVAEAISNMDAIEKDFNDDYGAFCKSLGCAHCGQGCGVFSYNLVPMASGRYTICHRGVFDDYVAYSNNLNQIDHLHNLAEGWSKSNSSKWIFDLEQLKTIQHTINKMYQYPHQIYYTDAIQQIKAYADAGIIDEKYQNVNEIIPTLGYFVGGSQCIQDSVIFTGSFVTRTPMEIPLFYNGAMDVIIDEINQVMEEKKEKHYEFIESL